jgi:hypothetical protein
MGLNYWLIDSLITFFFKRHLNLFIVIDDRLISDGSTVSSMPITLFMDLQDMLDQSSNPARRTIDTNEPLPITLIACNDPAPL